MTYEGFEVWRYGSQVRGDADSLSDRDVMIVGEPTLGETSRVLRRLGPDLSLSRYRWSEIEAMAAYGSLFLHHIRLEGKCFYESHRGSSGLSTLLRNLGPYTRAHSDLHAFETVVGDVEHAPAEVTTPLFEMSVLASVLRHSSVLGCYICGEPRFGRLAPFEFLVTRWSLPTEMCQEFAKLYRFRLHEEGRCRPPFAPLRSDVLSWTKFARGYLSLLGGEIDEYQARVRATN